jgi:hypothetical protein
MKAVPFGRDGPPAEIPPVRAIGVAASYLVGRIQRDPVPSLLTRCHLRWSVHASYFSGPGCQHACFRCLSVQCARETKLTDTPDEADDPCSEVEEWGVVLVGMQLRLVRLLLELLKKDY